MGGMSTSGRVWRVSLFTLCAISFAILVYGAIAEATLGAYNGITDFPTRAQFADRVAVAPSSPAYRAGLRSGDNVLLRSLSPDTRLLWRLGVSTRQSVQLQAQRGTRSWSITIVPSPQPATLDMWLAAAGSLWVLLFCVLIVWRRPDSVDAMILASALLGWTFIIGLFAVVTVFSVLPISLLSDGAIILFRILPVVYAVRLAGRASSLRALAWLAYAAAVASFVYDDASAVGVHAGWFDPFVLERNAWLQPFINGTLCPLLSSLCLLMAIAGAARIDRARVAWVALAITPFYLANFVAYVLINLGFAGAPISAVNVIINVTTFAMPIVLMYSLLSHRLLDMGFILNRAAVFSGVSIVLVGAFVLAEWLVAQWMSQASHTTNVAISAGVALVLGLSVRFVHARVDRLVDAVFFRKRHEDESAVRAFALEAPYVTDRALLLRRTVEILEQHSDATFARLMLADGNAYNGVTENDPAILRLRATHEVLDLHAVDSAIQGDIAYPMVARGRLLGVLVLGPRRSGERYAADESAAIAQLALSVGVSLDAFSKNDEHEELMDAIRGLPDAIAQRVSAVTPRG
jgi:hypothetical protein